MEKKNPNSVHLRLTDRELRMIKFIQKQEGQENIPAVIHDCVRDYYNRQYVTKYRQKTGVDPLNKVIDLTPEQLCEQVGGKVDNNARSCHFPPDSTGLAVTIVIPLGDTNDMLKEYNNFRRQGGRTPVEI